MRFWGVVIRLFAAGDWRQTVLVYSVVAYSRSEVHLTVESALGAHLAPEHHSDNLFGAPSPLRAELQLGRGGEDG